MGRFARIAACALVAFAASGVGGCASEDTVAGRVVDDTLAVTTPAIAAPSPDINAGFAPNTPSTSAGSPAPADQAQRNTIAAITGLGQYARVASVSVSAGERVETGDVLVEFDSRALEAELSVAKANQAVAKAQVRVIDDALDDVESGRATLAEARADALSAQDELTDTRSELVDKRAQLKDVLEALPPSIPATLPPGMPRPPDPKDVRAAIAQLDAGLERIDSGLGKIDSGLDQIASKRATLADARNFLEDARVLAVIGYDASKVAVKLARWKLDSVIVRAPESGVVISVAHAGDALAPSATVATIRPEGAARVTTWLTIEQLAHLQRRLGSSGSWDTLNASVSGDWARGEVYPAHISRVGVRSQYPPTSFATREVHLTRAIQIELEVEGPADLPPGAPADVTIR